MKTNLVGRRFGRLVVASEAESQNGCTRWNCVCDCGKETIVFYTNLIATNKKGMKSCGICPLVDLIGQRFSSLVVLTRSLSKKNRSRWVCQCDCGKTTVATAAALRSKHKKSCGCRFQLSLAPKNEITLCRSLWGTYKSLAKKRGFSFELSFEEFETLTKKNCFYCGVEPQQVLNPRRQSQLPYIYNGVDRRNNANGYILANAVPCCGKCNSFKSSHSVQDFLEHCERIINFQNSKKQTEMVCSAQLSE